MPELGKYTSEVLGAYGVTLALLGGIVALTLWQARRVRTALEETEGRDHRDG